MKKIKVNFYTKENCPLCDKAKKILENAGGRKKFDIREIDIEKKPIFLNKFFDKIPVIEIENKEYIFYPFNERSFTQAIERIKKSGKPVKIYNRNSKFYDFMESPMEILGFRKSREKFFKRVFENKKIKDMKILEIGIGTGKNIPYYPDETNVFGVDIAKKMLDRAKIKVEKENKNVYLLNMDVQHLAFKNRSFDMVFTTFAFCSVFDPIKGLKEIRRILKPSGKLYMLEHVRSENKFAGKIMDILDPVFYNLIGEHIARKTKQNLTKAGFKVKEEKVGGILRIFTAIP